MDTQEVILSQDTSKKVLIGTVNPKSSKESHTNRWRLVKLGDVCKNTDLVNPIAYPEKPFTYIDVSSVSNESYRIIETRRILGKDAPSRARKSIQADDVIFATVRPTLKRVAIIPSEFDGQVCSTGFCVLRANRKGLEPQYLYFLLLTEFVNQRVGLHPSDHSTAKVNISEKVLYTTAKSEQGDATCEADHAVENLNC
jgi:restriction endonuclease S subunit